ncbi:hypothetical protein V6N13_065874 [Hibiscus sabdariffa]|uniref:Uncharacterized protein n=2 Tax=Hibiscus sabdariffa TaxID=183260 RepID=A0ABR2A008_9ROSI
MEQSCGSTDVTDEDIMVAAILLELPGLISQSQSHSLHRTWGSKGKRSTSQSKLAAASLPTLKQSPPPPPSQHPPLAQPSKLVGSTYATVGPLEKAWTSSPATPLSFPPIDSDEIPLPPPKRKPHLNNLRKVESNLLAGIPDHTESFWKDIDSVKNLRKNRSELKVEDASMD